VSDFIVDAVEVDADGTLLQEKVTTILETPSQAKLLAEPEPVPKANVCFLVLKLPTELAISA
jgi:hypothetical protein